MQQEKDSNADEMGKMVAVARFENPVEAQMAKGMLESAGVESELTGENANQLIQAAFDVQLEVRTEDEDAARELLNAAGEKTGIPLAPTGDTPEEG